MDELRVFIKVWRASLEIIDYWGFFFFCLQFETILDELNLLAVIAISLQTVFDSRL